ncbi:MAG: hypothetical protein AAF620_12880 [Bacteroidota bacterium]
MGFSARFLDVGESLNVSKLIQIKKHPQFSDLNIEWFLEDKGEMILRPTTPLDQLREEPQSGNDVYINELLKKARLMREELEKGELDPRELMGLFNTLLDKYARLSDQLQKLTQALRNTFYIK